MDLEGKVQFLFDRQEIADCCIRYARGADRHDIELMESAFHPDALDDHGIFQGAPDELARWLNDIHAQYYLSHLHYLANPTVEIDGDVAHAETYFLACLWRKDESGADVAGGRYVDRFERREGEWRISERMAVREWSASWSAATLPSNLPSPATWDRSDPSYRRPLALR
jgi:SnoaL-like protein